MEHTDTEIETKFIRQYSSRTLVNVIQKMCSGLVEVYKFPVVGLKWNAFSSDPAIVEM